MLIGAAMLLAGTAARLLSLHEPMAFPLVVVCQLLASATGPVVLVLPPKLSSTWFPEERTTATAIASLANSLGGAVLFILGPGMIPGCDSLPRSASPADPAIVSAVRSFAICTLFSLATLATFLAAMVYPDAPRLHRVPPLQRPFQEPALPTALPFRQPTPPQRVGDTNDLSMARTRTPHMKHCHASAP